MTPWNDRTLHFIGIGGAGMSGLALVCHQLGAAVSGSDRADSSYMQRLRAAGLQPAIGHDPANLPADAEVVVSTAIGDDNPELALARERGQRAVHRGELLAELCSERRTAGDRRNARKDDHDRDGGLGDARCRRRSRLFPRR